MNGTEAVINALRAVEPGDMPDSPNGELLVAAECYITLAKAQQKGVKPLVAKLLGTPDDPGTPPTSWPWDVRGWNPHAIAKNNLRSAGVLIALEWDRLDQTGQ